MRLILKRLQPYWPFVLLTVLLLFFQALGELYLPTLMSRIIDEGVMAQNTGTIVKIGGFMLLVSLGTVLCACLTSFLSARTSMAVGRDLRLQVFKHVHTLSVSSFDTFGTSSLITRNTNDVMQVQQLVHMLQSVLLRTPLMLIGGIIMALAQDVELTKVLAYIVPFLIFFVVISLIFVTPLFGKQQVRLDKLNQVVREGLSGIRVIRAFNREKSEQTRFNQANHDLTALALRINRIFALMMPLFSLIFSFVNVAIIWVGAGRIQALELEPGKYMAFFQYASHILFSLMLFTMMISFLPRTMASTRRINAVLDTAADINDPAVPAAPGKKADLAFENVSFSYPNAMEPVLKNISFQAHAGETTAIIGSTGSGKSTLIQLIPRLFDASAGTITLGGVPIQDITQAQLRNRIGFIPQRATLFMGTIEDNLRYGKEDATEAEILHALEVAQAKDFVLALEDGILSEVAQGGTNYSGGQKQRLCIARALIRKPDVYIFDDSFSALDFKTDAVLRARLAEETKDATVLIVAQRVSTILNADRIIVLEDGEIAGIGTHQELLAICQTYQEIVHSQMPKEESA